jgi:hypothetical protein
MTAPPSPGGVFLGDVTALRPTIPQPDGALLDLTFEVPSHEVLVQDRPQDVPPSGRIKHVLPADFGDGTPVKVDMPPGFIAVMIRNASRNPSLRLFGVSRSK